MVLQYEFKLLNNYLDVKANIKCAQIFKTNKLIVLIILSIMTYNFFKQLNYKKNPNQ